LLGIHGLHLHVVDAEESIFESLSIAIKKVTGIGMYTPRFFGIWMVESSDVVTARRNWAMTASILFQ
jgi:hypothetical protein